jgi:hypothetical protein
VIGALRTRWNNRVRAELPPACSMETRLANHRHEVRIVLAPSAPITWLGLDDPYLRPHLDSDHRYYLSYRWRGGDDLWPPYTSADPSLSAAIERAESRAWEAWRQVRPVPEPTPWTPVPTKERTP